MDDDEEAVAATGGARVSSSLASLVEAEAEAEAEVEAEAEYASSEVTRQREAAASARYLSEAAIREFEAQYAAAAVAGVFTTDNDEGPARLPEPANENNTHDNRQTLTTTTIVTSNTLGMNTNTTYDNDNDWNDAEPNRAADADVGGDASSSNNNDPDRRMRRRNRRSSTDRILQQLLLPELRIPGPLVVLQGNIGDGISNTIDDMNAANGSNGSTSALPQVTTVGDQEQRRGRGRRNPPLSSSSLDENEAERNHSNAHPRDTTDPHVVLPPPRTTGATVAANARFSILPAATVSAVSVATASLASAAIPSLVEDDDDNDEPSNRRRDRIRTATTAISSSNTTTTSTNSLTAEEDRRAVAAWNNVRRRNELQQRRDFQESLVEHPNQASSSVDHVMMQQSHHPNRHHHTTTTTTTNPYWWERNGAIAILRELPTKLRDYCPSSSGSAGVGRHATTNDATANTRNGDNGGGGGAVYVPSSIGTLQPGTVVQALELIELDATTLVPILSNNKDTTTTSTKRERRSKRQQQQQQQSNTLNSPQLNKKHSYGRKGVIQMIKLETNEGRIGYACISLEGYPLLVPPDRNTTHTTSSATTHAAYNMELSGAASSNGGWRWRVTCPSGAYVRQGLDLNTQHLCTLPYGTLLQVTKRCINNQGLSRLQTTAIVPVVVPAAGVDHQDRPYKIIQGWCSELLNPLSGQRGIIAQPIAFPVPALYRVTLPIGAVIRRDIELSSPQIGTATFGSIVKICRRAYSEHPVDQCIERLKLVGNGGWISIRLNRPHPNDDLIVEFVDIDPDFDPEASGLYHIHEQRKVLLQQQQDRRQRRRQHAVSGRRAAAAAAALSSNNDITDLSSVDENDDDTDDDNDDGIDDTDLLLLNASTDLSSRSSRAITTNGSNSDSNVPHKPQLCVVCLTSERNATIVHGETGHVVCCLVCARILKARGDRCPVCRLNIDVVIQHFYA